MLLYCFRRLCTIIPVIAGITFFAFLLGYLSPGDPARAALMRYEDVQAEEITEEMVAAKRHEMGLDRPFLTQYAEWLVKAADGDLGKSMVDGRDIAQTMFQQLPCTIILAFMSLTLSLFAGCLLGVIMAIYYRSRLDDILNLFATLCVSVPGFWIALLLMSVLSVKYHLLPTSGYEGAKSLVMPVLVLSLGSIGTTARLMRAVVLKEKHKLYVLAAKAKGLSDREIMCRHILKNAILPVFTLNSNRFAGILGGAAIIESIFSLPGTGSYVLSAVANRDYYVVQAFVLYMGCIYVVTNLTIDIVHFILNPQIRVEKE